MILTSNELATEGSGNKITFDLELNYKSGSVPNPTTISVFVKNWNLRMQV